MNIYELTNDFDKVLNMLENEEIDEQTAYDTLEGIEGDIDYKLENCVKYVRNTEGRIQGLKGEVERLNKLKSSYEKNAKKPKELYVLCVKGNWQNKG